MKFWQVFLMFLASLCLLVAMAFGERLGYYHAPEFVEDIAATVAGVSLVGMIWLLGDNLLRGFGKENTGEEELHPDENSIRHSQMRFRRTFGFLCYALAIFMLSSGLGSWDGDMNTLLRMFIVSIGLYFLWGGTFWLNYRVEYNDNTITATTPRFKQRTHHWSDIVRTSRILTGDGTYLHFAKTGKAFISDFATGRDEILVYAKERLNDARTPRG